MGVPAAARDANRTESAGAVSAAEGRDWSDGRPSDWQPSALGAGFPGTRAIRSHRDIFKKRQWRPRLLVLATVLLVLATGVLVAQAASSPSGPAATPRPRIARTNALGNEAPSLSPPLPTEARATPTADAPSPSSTRSASSPASSPAYAPPATQRPAPQTSTPAPTTTPPFVPVTMEAEAGSMSGIAVAVACGSCSSGLRVGWIHPGSALVIRTNVPQSGNRTVRVTYSTDAPRRLTTQLNGVDVDVRWVNGTSFENLQTFQFSVSAPTGPFELRFYDDTSFAPDIDIVTIS